MKTFKSNILLLARIMIFINYKDQSMYRATSKVSINKLKSTYGKKNLFFSAGHHAR